jgi:hypothetical protein
MIVGLLLQIQSHVLPKDFPVRKVVRKLVWLSTNLHKYLIF